MNGININGVGNLGSLRSASCANYSFMPNQQENALPEQRDMVSLGQDTPELASQEHFNSVQEGQLETAKTTSETTSFVKTSVENNSVDAGNGLRATLMNDLGVLTMLDDSVLEAVDQLSEIRSTESSEMQNTLALVNINSMETILQNGLIAFNA